MRKVFGAVLSVVALLMVGAQAQGQRASGKASQQAPLMAVHVSGSERYKDADIAAATGLTLGTTVGPAEFQTAANKLVGCGAFETVEYKYGPQGTGYSVTFKVTDNSEMIPVGYDNFVWFTDKELNDAVQKRVPLFKGAVPATGDMLDEITEALQTVIGERGIQGTVKFLNEGSLGGPVERGMFSVDGPTVRVAAIRFPGAGDAEVPALQDAMKPLMKMPYQRSMVNSFADLNLKPVFRERGFLKVALGESELELLDKSPNDPSIAVIIPVKPGTQYKLNEISWSGVKAFDSSDLRKLLKVRTGVPANAVQLEKDNKSIVALYGTKGYLRAAVKPEPTFDDLQQTVSYLIHVTEGDIYRLRTIDIEGMDKPINARLREEWKMREGEPYDTSYEREYMKAVRLILTPNVSVQVEKQINDESHTVDVSMRFIVHADKVVH